MNRPKQKLLDELDLVVQPATVSEPTVPTITVPGTDPSLTLCTITMPFTITVTIAADA